MESANVPGTADHAFDPDPGDTWPAPVDNHPLRLESDLASSDHAADLHLETDGLYDDDVIGVSIGRVQTQMRSPQTPAAEKARALNLPLEHFHRALTLDEEVDQGDHGDPPRESSVTAAGSRTEDAETGAVTSPLDNGACHDAREVPQLADRPAPPLPVEHGQDDLPSAMAEDSSEKPASSRLAITRTFLKAMDVDGRRRSLSGPVLLSNLRKFLPDLPTAPFARPSIPLLSSGRGSPTGASTPTDRSKPTPSTLETPADPSALIDHADLLRGAAPSTSRTVSGLDGNVESLLSPISPASTKSRARSNSESSLYMKRKASGVSSYDDISAFANVTDMANSRFKAITDSFQNSTLKLPKLPTIRPSPKRRTSLPGAATATATDGARGPGDVPAESAAKGLDQYYTSIKKMRNARRGVEVETPQQRAHPILSHALSKTTGDVVIMGGYRGSILRSAQPPHRQVWVPMKVGLNLRKVDLEVGLTREDEERMEETIIPSGILSHIGPIDICRRLLRHIHKCPNARDSSLRLHEWGYDWRLSPDYLSARLITFLESLECNHPETPPEKRGATVIAHSLGGLITRHAVNQRPDLFAGVVYAGVPQHCVNILGPLRNGDDVLLSSRVLTAQVNFTLRTSFVLLPEEGRCFIQKHTNERFDLNFFEPRVWYEYRLSPCINPPLHNSLRDQERRKSLMGALSDSISSSSKRGSWFGGSGQPSPTAEPTHALETASQRGKEKATDAARTVEADTEQVVGPSMKQSQPQHRPTVATACTIPLDQATEYLARTLKEVAAFKSQLKFNPAHQDRNLYPPHAILFGKTVPTVYGARVANQEAIKYTDAFDDLAFAAGDGVVLASAAQLPPGYRCVRGGRIETDRGHVGLLGDLEAVGRCLEAVVDGRAKGVGLGRHFKQSKNSAGES